MSLVSGLGSMLMNTRIASDSEFGMMNTTNRMMSRVAQAGNTPGFGSDGLRAMHEQEKNDMANLQMMNLMRKIANSRAESDKKRLDYYA